MAPAITKPPLIKPRRVVCFSFAAYSKNLISHLHNSNVPIESGLTETELTTIESTFHFSFPPDLRSILQEGLPVGPGFPNWRSSSVQQLEILTNLPILGLIKEVHRRKFWHKRWGNRPEHDDEAASLANQFLKKEPVLVPVYRNCYIPSTNPCLAGNPVFYVNGLDVKIWSYDVVGFFQQTEFNGNVGPLSAPSWAATEARRIEFWTELVEGGGRWWRSDDLGRCLEEVWQKLRDGGWKEEDVTEMMMIIDGGDGRSSFSSSSSTSSNNREAVAWHVSELSVQLLNAGWSRGDVVDSLGGLDDDDDGEAFFEFQINNMHSCADDHDGHKISLKEMMMIQSNSIEVEV